MQHNFPPLHHLPPLVLGLGQTNLAGKFSCVLHAAYLEAGSTFESLQQFLSEVVSCTTDFGVEFGLSKVAPISIREALPWYPQSLLEVLVPAALHDIQEHDDAWAPPAAADAPPVLVDDKVSMTATLAIPGLLHILHNAADDLLSCMPLIESAVGDLVVVC